MYSPARVTNDEPRVENAVQRRPILLRLLPPSLRGSAWSRLYRPTTDKFHGLFERAGLQFASRQYMKLVPGDYISDSIAFTGVHDLQISRLVIRLAAGGGHMVDVGANLGYFSLLWSAVSPSNSVTAFEPSLRNLEYLKHNVELNGLQERIEIRSEAVGAESREMDFDVGPPEQTGWGGLTGTPSTRSVPVRVVRLDEALSHVREINLLKIDVEGADTWALLGAEELFRKKRIKHVLWEQNQPRMNDLAIPLNEANEFLHKLGYNARPISPRDQNSNWYASES